MFGLLKINSNNNNTTNNNLYFKALRIRHINTTRKKELVSTHCYNIPQSINDYETPTNNIENTLAIVAPTSTYTNYTNNSTEHPCGVGGGVSGTGAVAGRNISILFNNEKTARTRTRSVVAPTQKLNPYRVIERNYGDTQQYLQSRSKTFLQNERDLLKIGNSNEKPGMTQVYINATDTHDFSINYYKYNLVAPTEFSYQWIDTFIYKVPVPVGTYSLEDINTLFHSVLTTNKHYFMTAGGVPIYPMTFLYNDIQKKITLVSKIVHTGLTLFPPTGVSSWVIPPPARPLVPVVIIENNVFSQMIGFNANRYPFQEISYYSAYDKITRTNAQFIAQLSNTNNLNNININNVVSAYGSDQLLYGNTTNPLLSPFTIMKTYKPSNFLYGIQGGDSSSAHVLRKKYNTITDNTCSFRSTFGLDTTNAIAYGVPSGGGQITEKELRGGQPINTPTFCKSAPAQ